MRPFPTHAVTHVVLSCALVSACGGSSSTSSFSEDSSGGTGGSGGVGGSGMGGDASVSSTTSVTGGSGGEKTSTVGTGGTAGTGGVCASTQVSCNGECVSTDRDPLNCGDCDNACPNGEVCSDGACELTCSQELVDCDGSCIDPTTDRNYCGATADCASSGEVCSDGEVCSNGECALFCPPGQIECEGTCINPSTDRNYCGAVDDCSAENAGVACAAGEVCADGACEVSCQSGFVNCSGTCIDPDSNRNFCGASGNCNAANTGEACAAGEVCADGACEVSCQSGFVNCNGTCIDPDSNRNFCGASGDCQDANQGEACDTGEQCVDGACEVSCQSGLIDCDGTCIDPDSSLDHCGASGDCENANAGAACGSNQVCDGGVCRTTNCMTLSADSGAAGTNLVLSPVEALEDPTSHAFLHFSDPSLFVDISSSGTLYSLGDDAEVTVVSTVGNALFPAGDLRVANNGGVITGATDLPYVNGVLPNNVFETGLFPYWDDIDAETGGVYVEELAIDGIDALVIQWHNRPHYNATGAVTFQLQLFDSGPVRVRYVYVDVDFGVDTWNDGASATIGYQTETDAAMFSRNQAGAVVDGDVIDIVPAIEVVFGTTTLPATLVSGSNTWGLDVPGLAPGSYSLSVTEADGDLCTVPFVITG